MTATDVKQSSAPAQPRRKLPHLPVLDGVRGLAILLVLVHHFLWIDDVPLWRGVKAFGDSLFIGVDVFFVLSGFLITRILLQARGDKRYFRDFYIRRTLRIFPLYYAFLLVVFLLWFVGGRLMKIAPLDLGSLSVFPWVLFFAGNVLILIKGAPMALALNPLWSLSVEEHFYFVWPSLVRFISPRKMLWMCGGIIAGTLALRVGVVLLFHHLHKPLHHSQLSYFTLFRADALAAGAALSIALYLKINEKLIMRVAMIMMVAAAVPLIAITVVRGGLNYQVNDDAMWLYTALALFFCGGLALVVLRPRTLPARGLNTAFMRFFGKYSYGLYIFNLPVWVALGSVFEAKNLTGWAYWQILLLREALGWGITLGLALLSWNLLEKRCLKLKARFEPKGVEA